jgi:hypothetical protein
MTRGDPRFFEVAREPYAPRFAKHAAEAAPRLRRDADGKTRREERDAHALEERAVLRAEQILDEPIERALTPVDFGKAPRAPALFDFGRERMRQPSEADEVVPPFSGHARDHASRDCGIERKIGPERGQRVRSLATQVVRRHGRAW